MAIWLQGGYRPSRPPFDQFRRADDGGGVDRLAGREQDVPGPQHGTGVFVAGEDRSARHEPGVKDGTIVAVEPRGTTVELVLHADRGVEIPAQAGAVITAQSLIGSGMCSRHRRIGATDRLWVTGPSSRWSARRCRWNGTRSSPSSLGSPPKGVGRL